MTNRNNPLSYKYVCILQIFIIILLLGEKSYSSDEVYCGIYQTNNTGRRWLNYTSGIYDPVIYPSYKHANIECKACHHELKKEGLNCIGCHPVNRMEYIFHDLCRGCHERGHKGPIECDGCHPAGGPSYENIQNLNDKAVSPDKIILNKFSMKKGPIKFTHRSHSHYTKTCKDCHHKGEINNPMKCGSCHSWRTDGRKITSADAFHNLCKGCHKRINVTLKCDKCHDM